MATRRLHKLTRLATSIFSTNSTHYLSSARPNYSPFNSIFLKSTTQSDIREATHCVRWLHSPRHFSSKPTDDEESDADDSEYEEGSDGEDDITPLDLNREYSTEEKEAEAAAIGYKVVGPLLRSDQVFKPYEPVFAVVQIGSHQFKVSNGDSIFVEKLKFCEVNDKLILNKVLLLGSSTQTVIGRPTLPEAAVHAVVEEHALDAKVIIFKKKRRKNYRRTNGHRQELTKLRITDIQGIEKPETKLDVKPLKTSAKKPEKVAVAA